MTIKPITIARYLLTGILTLGVIICIGTLSFTGLLMIYPSLWIASIGFILAAAIEAIIYQQNIFKGFKKLALLGYQGLEKLLTKELRRYVDDNLSDPLSDDIKRYIELRRYYKGTKGQKLDKAQYKRQTRVKRELRRLEHKLVSDRLHKNQDSDFISQQTITYLKLKLWGLRLGSLLALGTTIASTIVTASALYGALATVSLTLSATALAAIVWPLAIIAAIGFTVLVYRTLVDILTSNLVSSWLTKLKAIYSDDPNKLSWRYAAKVTGVTLLFGLTFALVIFATVATAGTWLHLIANLPSFLGNIGSIILYISLALYIGFTFIFSLRSAWTTASEVACILIQKAKILLTAKLKVGFDCLKKKFATLRTQENWIQLINPFRFISQLVMCIALPLLILGHLLSVGATTDRVSGIHPIVVAVLCSLEELFEDLPYLNNQDHDHNNLASILLKITLSPILFCSAMWAYSTSQLNRIYRKPADNPSQFGRETLSLITSFSRAFGIKQSTEPVDSPLEPPSWFIEQEQAKTVPSSTPAQTSGCFSFWRKLPKPGAGGGTAPLYRLL